jgi:hypothetical protein
LVFTAKHSSASSASTVKADPINGQPVPARDNFSNGRKSAWHRTFPLISPSRCDNLFPWTLDPPPLHEVVLRSSIDLIFRRISSDRPTGWQRGLPFALFHIVSLIYLTVYDMAGFR